jgi:DnaK suppressor protein
MIYIFPPLAINITFLERNDEMPGQIKSTHIGKTGFMASVRTDDDMKSIGDFERIEIFPSTFLMNLIAKKEEIEKALNRLIDSQKENRSLCSLGDVFEELDQADREISARTIGTLIERKNNELKKITILIRRAQNDEEFGFCEECGERIPEQRLLIVPEATRCIPCQRELEKLESRIGLAKQSPSHLNWNKKLEWEEKGDANGDFGFFIKTDMEHLSFIDPEED